jgi:hypothetical protein
VATLIREAAWKGARNDNARDERRRLDPFVRTRLGLFQEKDRVDQFVARIRDQCGCVKRGLDSVGYFIVYANVRTLIALGQASCRLDGKRVRRCRRCAHLIRQILKDLDQARLPLKIPAAVLVLTHPNYR